MNLSKQILLLEKLIGKKIVLREDKISDLKNIYVASGKLSESDFNRLLKLDNKPYKFLQWIIKQYLLHPEHLKKIKQIVDYYSNNQQQLNSKGLGDLYQYTLPEAMKNIVLVKQVEIKDTGAELVGNDGDKYLYLIKNKEASKKYGSNTRWCIAATASQNMWSYYSDSIFFFLIDKSVSDNINSKIAIQIVKVNFDKNENYLGFEAKYWNQQDTQIQYILSKKMKDLISKKINSKENLNKLKEEKRESEEKAKYYKKLIAKQEREKKTMESLESYLKLKLPVPRELTQGKSLDLRGTNIKSLRNIKSLDSFIASPELESFGQLTSINFADLRGVNKVRDFHNLKSIDEVYVNSQTSSELKRYLKTITNNYIEV